MSRRTVKLGDAVRGVVRGVSSSSRRFANILEFIESPSGLGRRPFPVQRVIMKAFYGVPLDTGVHKNIEVRDFRGHVLHRFNEADYLKWKFDEGDCNIREVQPGLEREQLVLPVGRRSGKTEMAAWIANYTLDQLLLKDNPQEYYGIGQGDDIMICSIATNKDQAAVLYAKARGMFMGTNRFDGYQANVTSTYARFQTKYEIDNYGRFGEVDLFQASLQMRFYSCVAKSIRGVGAILIILDEYAHFNREGQGSDKEVYKAATPSLGAFSPKDPADGMTVIGPLESKVVMISSPLGKEGHFYERFQAGFHRPDRILSFRAPTWEVNPTVPSSLFEESFIDDPKTFWIEWGARFDDSTSGWIDDRKDLVACVDTKLRPVQQGMARRPHFIGIDLGVTKGGDGTGIALVHLEEDGLVVLDHIEWLRAGIGKFENYDRLDFDELAQHIYDLSKRFYIVEGVMDQAVGSISVEQKLSKMGLDNKIKAIQFTSHQTSAMFKSFKDLMWDKKLRLFNAEPDPDLPGKINVYDPSIRFCGYLEELMTLQAEVVSKHVTKVEKPKRKGCYDDRSDALVRAVWLASQKVGDRRFVVSTSSRSAVDMALRSRPRHNRRFTGGSHPSRQVPRRRGSQWTGRR